MPSKAASSDKLAGQLMLVCAIAFSIAFVTILLAHIFERFGYAPCPLCLQERYAYYFGMPATAFITQASNGSGGLARHRAQAGRRWNGAKAASPAPSSIRKW